MDGVSRPQVIERVPPLYPEKARTDLVEGEVYLRVRVRMDGTVAGAQILNVTHQGVGFEMAAMDVALDGAGEGVLGPPPLGQCRAVQLETLRGGLEIAESASV